MEEISAMREVARYDHVIVPFDGSERAREAAMLGADLGTLFDARLHLVTSAELTETTGLHDLKDRAVAMSDNQLDMWVEPDRRPARAIARVIEHRPNSLVCMSTSARPGLLRAVYGSVAEDLLRGIDAPVVLLGPKCDQRDPVDIRQLVVCVDSSDASSTAAVLGKQWAAKLEVPVTLVHVRSAPVRPSDVAVDLQAFVDVLLEANQAVEEYVVANNDTAQAILDVIGRSGGSMAVMATHARTGFRRLRRGSIVADVVRRSPVPLLVRHIGVADGDSSSAAPSDTGN
jgi:nucleotide-binding universal stress UspA family protein